MTRMVRAQYERDDVLEADIVCNGRRTASSSNVDGETEQEWIDAPQHKPDETVVNSLHSRAQALTWKMPAWVDFSYATINRRGGRTQHRRPNPFGPHKDLDLTQQQHITQPLESHVPNPTIRLDGPSKKDEFPWNSPFSEQKHNTVQNFDVDPTSSAPVVSHPPPIPWDDQSTIDLPYDNPFYTRTINNVLWLPRNPAGILDLDDTVELKVAIPVEPSAGRLGTWLGIRETSSPDEISESPDGRANQSENDLTSMRATSLIPEINGTEDIELPPIIAKRVQAREPDIDYATLKYRKSSVFTRKTGASDKASLDARSVRTRRPSVLDKSGLSYHSFSNGAPSPGRPRSASMMTTLQVPSSPVQHPYSSDEFGVRPDAHAQAEFIAANKSTSQLSLPPKMGRGQNVSASQAIFHEILEEERQALEERIQEETAEAHQTQSTKSWLTSWMFKKTT